MPVRDSRSFDARLMLHIFALLFVLIGGWFAYQSVGPNAIKSINDFVAAVGGMDDPGATQGKHRSAAANH
jgi:hypothetical protein